MFSMRLTGSVAVLTLMVFGVAGVLSAAEVPVPAPVEPTAQLAEMAEFRLSEAKDFFEMGWLEDCAKQWEALMSLDPPPALCLKLRQKFGFELLTRMMEEEKLTKPVTEFLKRASQEEARLRRDPAHIKALVDALSGTPTERRRAMYELKQVGERAVPELFVRLSGAADPEERLRARLALEYMGARAVPALVVALEVKDPALRRDLVMLLGKARDLRALPPLKALLEDKEQPAEVRQAARWALEHIQQGASERSAADYYFELGELYYYQSPEVQPGYFEPQVPLWRWDAEKQAITCVEVSRRDFYIERSKECCYRGLALAPTDCRLRELLVSTYFLEKQLKGGEADAELTKRIGLLVRTGGKPVLLAALRRQLQDDRPDLALAVIDVLRTVVSGEGFSGAERSVKGNPLLEALDFPDQLLNFFAAEAVAEAAPKEPFEGQQRVVPYLTWGLLWGSGVRTALVAASERPLLNAFVGHLRALGYKVHEATSVAEAVEISRGLPTPMLVVAESAMMTEVRSALLADFRTRFACRVVVSAPGSQVQEPEGQPEVSVPADIQEAALGKVLEGLLSRSGLQSRLSVEPGSLALRAAQALAKLSRGGTVLDVAPASGALLLVVGHKDQAVRLAVLEALGNTRDPAALDALLALGANKEEAGEVRLGALNAARVVLSAMDRADKKVYDALVALLDDEEEGVRRAAAACLSSGPFSAEQIVAILAAKKVLKGAE